jgi:hypothetical protein
MGTSRVDEWVPARASLGRDDSLSTPIAFARALRHHAVRPAAASAGLTRSRPGDSPMTLSVSHLSPIISLIAGILILIMPRLLNFIVAIYLIIIGVIGLGLIR